MQDDYVKNNLIYLRKFSYNKNHSYALRNSGGPTLYMRTIAGYRISKLLISHLIEKDVSSIVSMYDTFEDFYILVFPIPG